MSKRSAIAISVAALSALALTLTGCASGGVPGGGGSGGAGSELKLAFLNGISTPDPDTAYDDEELNLVNSAYEGLLTYEPGVASPKLTGLLATKWTANDDDTVFDLTLRKDVTFHDGTPFDASAVKASFDRRNSIDAGPAYMTKYVKSVEAPSPHEVVITLNSPNSAFLDLLASPFGPKMISPTAIEKHPAKGDEDWFDTHDAGTGPYEYGDFVVGSSYELTAAPHYWGSAPGYKRVHFDVISSLSTIELQLKSGQLDGLIGYSDKTTFASFEKTSSLKTYRFSSMQTPTMFINPKSRALGDDATRKAFVAGVDRRALTEAALGDTAKATDELFPEHLIPASENRQPIAHDAGAWSALSEGALAGKTITIGYNQSSPAAQALSDNLAASLNKAGITAKSTGYANGNYYSELEKGADAADVTFFTGFPDTAHPDAWATVFYTPNGGLDLFGAEVPGVADLLDKALVSGDQDDYARVVQLVGGSGYWTSIAQNLGTAVFQDNVTGVDTSWNPIITGVLDLAELRPSA